MDTSHARKHTYWGVTGQGVPCDSSTGGGNAGDYQQVRRHREEPGAFEAEALHAMLSHAVVNAVGNKGILVRISWVHAGAGSTYTMFTRATRQISLCMYMRVGVIMRG